MPLSPSQQQSVETAVWRMTAPIEAVAEATTRDGNPYETRLVGPAGTGKTYTLLAILDALAEQSGRDIDGIISLMAPTWRAAKEMQKATGRQSSSCHRQFYAPPTVGETGELEFNGKLNAPTSLQWAVMDEASMIGTRLGADSRSWAHRTNEPPTVNGSAGVTLADARGLLPVRRLIVGDHAQLSPVNDSWGFDLESAECQLTEVFRQALDSPILDFATRWREGRVTAWRDFDRWTPGVCECFGRGKAPSTSAFAGLEGSEKLVAKVMDAAARLTESRAGDSDEAVRDPVASVLICWTNNERETLNQVWRQRLRLPAEIVPGERLLSFSNFSGMCNGDLVDVAEVSEPFVATYRNLGMVTPKRGGSLQLKNGFPAVGVRIEGFPEMQDVINPSRFAAGLPYFLDGMTHLVAVDSISNPTPRRMDGRYAYYTSRAVPLVDAEFGYAITAHRSQGSTFDVVGVVNPAGMADQDEYRRWVYVAATRPRHVMLLMV